MMALAAEKLDIISMDLTTYYGPEVANATRDRLEPFGKRVTLLTGDSNVLLPEVVRKLNSSSRALIFVDFQSLPKIHITQNIPV